MKEYNNLIYNDDFTYCLGLINKNDKICKLHPQTIVIKSRAFNSSALEKIEFNEKLELIGTSAFASTDIASIDLSNTNVTEIKKGAFFDCRKLNNIQLSKNLRKIHEFAFAQTSISSIKLPDTVEKLSDYCFAGTQISELILPEALRSTGTFIPFYEMSNIKTLFYKNNSTYELIKDFPDINIKPASLEMLLETKTFNKINEFLKKDNNTER